MSKQFQAMEWHDSTLMRVERKAENLSVLLRPAYVHKWAAIDGKWVGEGHVQDVDVIVQNGESSDSLPKHGTQISDAELWISGREVIELLPIGYNAGGSLSLKIVLETGETLAITGTEISIKSVGEPRFVESLPIDYAPKESPA
jgi:hypothetical protein